ncbi:GH1 family beta-glucosidase [Cerasicoccus frondis]|uniref:GH1 family beta-glucosidase n=1 Tax=Cerasicoccus frondis TaxID=490090 RepID=UPI002852CC72|nr:GH1 family beta-glucosidase [Cerasicoccus frondis]
MNFPKDFIWGAATSSFQIEGARRQDGGGPSIWEMFTAQPNKTWEGDGGEVACDHYNRYEEDVECLAQIGVQAYRFSVSWPRIQPDGLGPPNKKGLDFYDRLVDRLLEKGVEPWITLYHWDMPYGLFLRGGWLNPDSPAWFERYTTCVVKRLSDRVTKWMTINEPQGFIGLGYLSGEQAPGLKLGLRETLIAGHNSLLAHGRSVAAIREHAIAKPIIGWPTACSVYQPITETPENINAARKASAAIYPDGVWNNRWWGDPVILGHYPDEGLSVYGKAVPKIDPKDFEIICQPLDFLGCNLFHGIHIKANDDGSPAAVKVEPGHPQSTYHWKTTPESIYWGTKFMSEFYRLPLIITENGYADNDMVGFDGRVRDQNRIEFISRYLIQLHRAIQEGIDIRGYFYWSLLDNFEWQEGYRQRFGLVHVDYQTQQRTMKDSAYWLHDIISTNGESLSQFKTNDNVQVPYIIRETKRYIYNHIGEPFKIKEIADHLRCHPDFLSREFKRHMEVMLSSYIRQARIDHAKEMLKNPKTLIDDAAYQSGFSDRVHFTKVFRRLTGQTPGQYQKQFREMDIKLLESGSLKVNNPRSTKE